MSAVPKREGRFEIWKKSRANKRRKKRKGKKPDDSKRPIKRTEMTGRELRGPVLGSANERRPSGHGLPRKGSMRRGGGGC